MEQLDVFMLYLGVESRVLSDDESWRKTDGPASISI